MKKLALSFLSVFIVTVSFSQQVADTAFNPVIQNPEYELGKGPVVFIDEGHFNFHTKDGRYLAFSKLLEKDGYVVKSYIGQFETEGLSKGKILVIANALNKINDGPENWILPTPSAFTKTEIDVVQKWVSNGGSLFLIADHMPWPGAAEELASAFGFKFYNGFNIDFGNRPFRLTNETLVESIITTGRVSSETVQQIPNTEGQAFQIPDDATSILRFDNLCLLLLPDTAWQFNSNNRIINIEGWSQGAYKKHGEGKIVVFGEASMFSAQVSGPEKRKMGMNSDDAKDNYKLLLNIIHWLDGKLE